MNPDVIPAEVRERGQWLMWDASHDTPRRPHWDGDFGISWSDPDDWHSFEEAVEAAQATESYGIGYVIQPDDPIYVIDLDSPYTDSGHERDWLPGIDFFEATGCYIERSPSGNGIHIPVRGEPPEWWRDCEADPEGHQGVECLNNKFCSFTGDLIQNGPILDLDPEPWLIQVYENIRGESPDADEPDRSKTGDRDELTREEVEELISYCDNLMHYNDWIRVGYAVHSWDDGKTGRDVFESWSRKSSKFDREGERVIEWIWNNANPDGKIGVGTLVHYAKQGGWQPPKPVRPNGGATAARPGSASGPSLPSGEQQEVTPQAVAEEAGVSDVNQISTHYEKAYYVYQVIRRSEHFRATADGEVFHYRKGIWHGSKADPPGEQRLRELGHAGLGPEYGGKTLDELVEKVRAIDGIPRHKLGIKGEVRATPDGLLDLREGKITRELEPEDYALNRISVAPDPQARYEGSDFAKFIEGAVPDETERLKLQEYAGYTLLPGQPYKKALFCIGPTDSGKGTFLKAITAVLGKDNVANQTLKNLVDSRWGLDKVFGQMANIRNEVTPKGLSNISLFKEMTGGEDTVSAESKGKPTYEFVVTQKFLFATNQFPRVPDADDAFFNRCLFVEFPNTVPTEKQDHELNDKLREERPVILNWMLEGLRRLLDQEQFTAELSIDERRALTKSFGSSIEQFVYDCLELTGNPEDMVHKSGLHDALARYCNFHDFETPVQRTFTTELKSKPGVSDGQSRRVSKVMTIPDPPNQPDVFKGIRVNELALKEIQADAPAHVTADDHDDRSGQDTLDT